jgi:hypothetical protein
MKQLETQLGRPSLQRAFGTSTLCTVFAIGIVWVLLGFASAIVTAILIAIEVAFSFDNAVVNAKILGKLSVFWRRIFLTVGMVIAVLGMRIVFPVLLVMLTAHETWHQTLHLALHNPRVYAQKLTLAHPVIAAFGGAFLLMLALQFFLDDQRSVVWFAKFERLLQRFSTVWLPTFVAAFAVLLMAAIPANHHTKQALVAGCSGIVVYLAINAGTHLLNTAQRHSNQAVQTGLAAFSTFVYLEILDASFSFDSVLGAFAITGKLVLIAVGLGIGALWVRSLTIFMVQSGTLKNYIYLEHGAHYTIAVLAVLLLASVVFNVPDVIAGLAGLGFIGASIAASRRVRPA